MMERVFYSSRSSQLEHDKWHPAALTNLPVPVMATWRGRDDCTKRITVLKDRF